MNSTLCSFLLRFYAVFKHCLNASINLLLNTFLFLNHGGVSCGLVPPLCKGSVPSWAMGRFRFSRALWGLFDQMVKTIFFVPMLLSGAATLWKCGCTFTLVKYIITYHQKCVHQLSCIDLKIILIKIKKILLIKIVYHNLCIWELEIDSTTIN